MCASPNAKRVCRVTSSSERLLLLSSDYICFSATGVRYVTIELLVFKSSEPGLRIAVNNWGVEALINPKLLQPGCQSSCA